MTRPRPGKVRGRAKDERTRTFTGCRTCRSRHAKCDEEQPECGVCRRLDLPCGGYMPRLFWVADDSSTTTADPSQPAYRASQYRFPLFSESERRDMSSELSASLGPGATLDRVLLDLDSASFAAAASHISQCGEVEDPTAIVKGPFGVFRAGQPHQASLASRNLAVSPPSLSGAICGSSEASIQKDNGDGWADDIPRPEWSDLPGDDEGLDFFTHPMNDHTLPVYQQGTATILGDSSLLLLDPALSSFMLDYATDCNDMAMLPFGLDRSPQQAMLPNGMDDVELETETGVVIPTASRGSRTPRAAREAIPGPPLICPSPGRSGEALIPEHAASLLRYYKQYLETTSTSMQAKRQSPWQVIFLPCALETFSELTLWNTTSHTRLAILSTLLAQSAFLSHRLNRPTEQEEGWRSIGSKHLKKAQGHLQMALEYEVTGPRQAPYKELLMAILALVVASLYQDATAFRAHLLNAERLMRSCDFGRCGLSSSVRILHHMYTHLRVIAESVSLAPNREIADSECRSVVDTRAFRITEDSLNLSLDDAVEKSQELGLKDIHLQSSGLWKQTMFPSIYGIPESLITLVAKTVSLANELKQLDLLARCNPKTSLALSNHIKKLEKTIWSWSLAKETSAAVGPARPPHLQARANINLLDHQCAQLMTLSIHQALIIYFYRRIHDVSAMLLQDAVRRVLDHLEPCMEEMINDQDFAPSLAWPAFIAASEAVGTELQQRALGVLDMADNRGFFFTPVPPKKIVLAIWKRREQTGDMTIGWASVMAELGAG